MKRIVILGICLCLLLCGCRSQEPGEAAAADTAVTAQTMDASALFSDRDLEGDYDENSPEIRLEGETASCDDSGVTVAGSTVTVTGEGCYILRGHLTDGMIIVDTDKESKVQLVLAGVSIHSESCAPIYIRQADKVFITLAQGTENTLTNGGSFTELDGNSIDGTVFSKEDVTFNGTGSLAVESPGGHGIVSKDELTVTGGSYTVTAASHGLEGKDSVCIAGGSFTLNAGKDGIHAENDDDTSLGFVYIADGSFAVAAQGDGISAGAQMQLLGGTYTVTTGGGSVNAQTQTSESWGMMPGDRMPGSMGGGPGDKGERPGGFGGMEEFPGFQENTSQDATGDSESIKGIKAGGDLLIAGGSFTMDCADDAVHSNAALTVTGGTFQIASGDDGFHADDALSVQAGSIRITESYEGLEGISVSVSGGDIHIVSTDDGINAAGGTDGSGMGGFRGGDRFGSAGNENCFIRISGGDLWIQASGDGMDSNGSLEIAGGTTTVCGPTRGDTAVLDYETTGIITGGTFVGTGSMMMAQTFSESEQGVIALSVGNQTAGTAITVKDDQGSDLLAYTPELDYAIFIFSSPELVKGEEYTVSVGTASKAFEAQ